MRVASLPLMASRRRTRRCCVVFKTGSTRCKTCKGFSQEPKSLTEPFTCRYPSRDSFRIRVSPPNISRIYFTGRGRVHQIFGIVFSAQTICTLWSLRPIPGTDEDSEEIEQQAFDLTTSDDVTRDTKFLTVFIMHHQSSQEQTFSLLRLVVFSNRNLLPPNLQAADLNDN